MDKQVATTKINLPADFADRLVAGIAESRASTVLSQGGKHILRLLKGKGGRWVFGQGDEEVQEGSRWLINTASLRHGFVCWAGGKIRGEAMTSVFDDKPPQPDPITTEPIKGQTVFPFKEQRSFDLKCIDGDDAGTEVIYKISSDGGLKETDRLMVALTARSAETRVYLFPVVHLKMDGYPHSEFGWINTPIFEIVGWTDCNGEPEGERQMAGEEALQPAQPQRQRKAPVGTPPANEPQTTQQAHAAPQRRRPGR